MTEERRLLSTGIPLEDIISDCHALRREVPHKEDTHHVCSCGGTGICPGCPSRKHK